MKTTVWKFSLGALGSVVSVDLPIGAQVLHVAAQGDGLFTDKAYLWARVDPLAAVETRRFRWAGTGHEMSEDVGEYVGTWMMGPSGRLVFHLFEMKP